MSKRTNICICGGGNLGHVIAGHISAVRDDIDVRLMTRNPGRFPPKGSPLFIETPDGREEKGFLSLVTDSPAEAVSGADIVLVCLPGFAIPQELRSIAPFLSEKTTVGSVFCSSGFFPMAEKILPKDTRLFGFQRVPYIARIKEYGRSAHLTGFRSECHIATVGIPDPEAFRREVEGIFGVRINLLDSHLEATLTNSNPLLHPSRMYALFGDGKKFDRIPFFYEEWDNASSRTYIECDNEFQRVREGLGIPQEAIPTALEHYESTDAESMTRKIRSIPSLAGIPVPMVRTEDGGLAPDYTNRYFTEDIPFGMLITKSYAIRLGIETPAIDRIIRWAQDRMGKEYLLPDGTVGGKDIDDSVAVYI